MANVASGLNFLRGRTEYGDSIEDEWAVVWLLRELSKQFSSSWIKLTDADGEFLLIEASGTLPSWLEPEVAENRVWINDGQLKIIKPASSKAVKHTDEKLSLGDAHNIISNNKKRLLHSTSMEEEAFYRLRNYPEQIKDNMHHAIIAIPRKLAYLLLQKAAYVAPAIEAFYLRDPISLKSIQSKDAAATALFLPSDMVELSITFPRVAYAQLKSQEFPTIDGWKQLLMKEGDQQKRAGIETGMKLTCGFEMLLTDSQYQDQPAVREMHLLLEDLGSGEAEMPSDPEIASRDKRADDEKWMDISFDDLQTELNASAKNKDKAKKPEFGDKAAQDNLQRIVRQFEAFLNDNDAEEGMGAFGDEDEDDELDDDDSDDLDEDKEASFAEADFTKLMQEMMGLPPEVMDEMMKGDISAFKDNDEKGDDHDTDMSSDDENEDAEIQELARRMGAELHASGALDDTTAASSKQIKTSHQLHFNDSDEEMFDRELTRNMIESFRAQAGQQGPASNLLGMMAEREAESAAMGRRKGKEPAKPRTARPATPQPSADLVEDVD